MTRGSPAGGVILTALILVMSATMAAAIPPTLHTVSVEGRRPAATFSAPRSDFATVYFSSKPDRATNGRFLDENVKDVRSLTTSEIQTGFWMDASTIDPGAYWVMLLVSPDFGQCWIVDDAAYDPACADGFSNQVTMVVPKPRTKFTTSTTASAFLDHVDVKLTARPLGEKVRYRVCYRNTRRVRRCVNGVLAGHNWDADTSDTLSVRSRNLPRVTTFTWLVAGRQVASRRVRVR